MANKRNLMERSIYYNVINYIYFSLQSTELAMTKQRINVFHNVTSVNIYLSFFIQKLLLQSGVQRAAYI